MHIVGIDLSGPSNSADTALLAFERYESGRGAPIDAVRTFKDNEQSRRRLLGWLEGQGLHLDATAEDPSDHYVAASAAALATWKWYEGESVWCYAASAPFHPFDYAC